MSKSKRPGGEPPLSAIFEPVEPRQLGGAVATRRQPPGRTALDDVAASEAIALLRAKGYTADEVCRAMAALDEGEAVRVAERDRLLARSEDRQ